MSKLCKICNKPVPKGRKTLCSEECDKVRRIQHAREWDRQYSKAINFSFKLEIDPWDGSDPMTYPADDPNYTPVR